MRILAIDIGSTSVKAGLWSGRAFAPPVRVPFPTRLQGVTAEIPPEKLFKAVLEAGQVALRGTSEIDAVSFCIFSSGVIVTDKANRPLTAVITHADRRSSD